MLLFHGLDFRSDYREQLFTIMYNYLQLFTKEVPKASYVKALDIWMMGCDTFVFLSIIEFILASIFLKRKMKIIGNESFQMTHRLAVMTHRKNY